jgi:Ser/Thr protein kinase RdoA (MazF antagonist)
MWDATLNQAKQGTILKKAAELWDADFHSVKLIHSGMNLIFKMKCQSKMKYLQITHPLIKSRMEVAAAIDYQQHLFATGAPICQPIKSKRGHLIEEISDAENTFLACVNHGVQGEAIHSEHNEKQIFETWGKSLAHLHRAAKSYHPQDTHQFLYWRDLWEEVGRFAAHEDKIIRYEYDVIDEWFNQLNQNQHDFGLTHGDYRSENVIYDGQRVHILGVDEPVYHWYFADVARPFLDFSEKYDSWKEKATWFLDGYYTIVPFDENNIRYLPWFIRMKNMDMYLWMKNNPAANNDAFINIRLAELREKIENPLLSWD